MGVRAPPALLTQTWRPRMRVSWSAVVAIVAPAVLLAALGWHHRWTADDGFIHFRVVEQLLHGNGLVFNAGERIEATTSPAWVGVLALTHLVVPVRIEYLALWLALLGSVFGLVAGCVGALRLASRDPVRGRGRPLVVPFGAVVVAALPPFWDYATSGLEMGMVFAWLGASFWATVVYADATPERRDRYGWRVALLLGLGPLIRPDLGLFFVCFVAALLVVDDGRGWGRGLRLVGVALALPVAYEVFRMGYFAAVVPNTAIAKSAGTSEWSRGVAYLRNFAGPYKLVVPVAFVVGGLVALAARLWSGRARRTLAVAAAPVVGGALHGLYVIRVGGDYMHARMLLPALFAVALPVMVLAVRSRVVLVAAALLAIWALVCAASLRAASDDRGLAITGAHTAHPVTLHDFRNHPWLRYPPAAKREARRGVRVLEIPVFDTATFVPLSRAIPADVGVAAAAIGMESYDGGTGMFFLDRFGLADPVGSRFSGQPLVEKGHDKHMSDAWVQARAVAPSAGDGSATTAARDALRCGDLARLLRDVRAPLTIGRFLGNLLDAPRLTRLTVPSDPIQARAKFCRKRASVARP